MECLDVPRIIAPLQSNPNEPIALRQFRFHCLCALPLCSLRYARPTQAQQPGKIFRIGFLDASTASGSAVLVEAFRQELSKLGWIEGKNITIEYRFAEQKSERLPELAADLVRLKVDLIVVSGTPAGVSGQERHHYHPHRDGERWGPRGCRFGCQSGAAGRQCHRALEFSDRAKHQKAGDTQGRGSQARPSWTSAVAGSQAYQDLQLKELRPAALALKLKLEEIETQPDAKGLESAFQTAKQKQVNAIMTTQPLAAFSPKESGSSSLPANTGCLLFTSRRSLSMRAASCPTGRTIADLYRRAAVYVDKILKGAKPADLPVQQATKFEFVINLKAAKQIGLTIPVRVLERANQSHQVTEVSIVILD